MEQTAEKIKKTEAEWKEQLTHGAISRDPRSGYRVRLYRQVLGQYEAGAYHCVCCGAPLFDSQTKFDSGYGLAEFLQASPLKVA